MRINYKLNEICIDLEILFLEVHAEFLANAVNLIYVD